LRILLTGRNGQVGWELERALPVLGELIAMDRSMLDLGDSDAIKRMVRETKPDLIVNAAAYTAVDRAESEAERAMQVNGIAPGVLADEAGRIGALLVHYSTDYIFDGEKRSPYLETDVPNPINVYGRTKVEGEKRIGASKCRSLILRTSWVYAKRGKNFFITIAKKALAKERLRIVKDQHGVPSESRFVVEMTLALLRADAEGVYHVVPSGATTWHGFASAIVERLAPGVPVEAISTNDYPTRARRPAYSVLGHAKLAQRVGESPSWESLLERGLTEWLTQFGVQPMEASGGMEAKKDL
jgi:dTDP-4-dehydrorhamnose reductase